MTETPRQKTDKSKTSKRKFLNQFVYISKIIPKNCLQLILEKKGVNGLKNISAGHAQSMPNNAKYFFIESKDKYYYFIMVNIW